MNINCNYGWSRQQQLSDRVGKPKLRKQGPHVAFTSYPPSSEKLMNHGPIDGSFLQQVSHELRQPGIHRFFQERAQRHLTQLDSERVSKTYRNRAITEAAAGAACRR
jgi:hypothetical protein